MWLIYRLVLKTYHYHGLPAHCRHNILFFPLALTAKRPGCYAAGAFCFPVSASKPTMATPMALVTYWMWLSLVLESFLVFSLKNALAAAQLGRFFNSCRIARPSRLGQTRPTSTDVRLRKLRLHRSLFASLSSPMRHSTPYRMQSIMKLADCSEPCT